MPELPEVQTVVDDLLHSSMVGSTIKRADIFWPKTVSPVQVSQFKKQICNRTVKSVSRRAKYIVIELDNNQWLLIHLRMTGRLTMVQSAAACSKHDHVIFHLGRQTELRFNDTRKFGRILLTKTPAQTLDKLGVEPLSNQFTPAVLTAIVHSSSKMIKPLLLDQTKIAGIGNIYADEALFAARIHPTRCAHTLSAHSITLLHQAIIAVLKKGIKNLGTTLGSASTNFYSVQGRRGQNREQLQVFRRQGLPCPICKKKLNRIIVAQRSTHLCTHCQK